MILLNLISIALFRSIFFQKSSRWVAISGRYMCFSKVKIPVSGPETGNLYSALIFEKFENCFQTFRYLNFYGFDHSINPNIAVKLNEIKVCFIIISNAMKVAIVFK